MARIRATLERAVARHCPPWLADRADDLVQQALVKLMQGKGEELTSLSNSYLWRTAYCVTVDAIRQERRRREEALSEGVAQAPSRAPRADPEAGVRAGEIRMAMSDCLGRMLDKRRRAVTLYLQGHTVPETARLMGGPVKAADNNLYRGLADLRKCLRSKGVTP